MIVTLAWPPPSHMVCRPKRPPVRSSSCSSEVMSRAPVQPIGCPRAIAPPLGFTRLGSALEFCDPGQHDGRKRFVDFDGVDVVD